MSMGSGGIFGPSGGGYGGGRSRMLAEMLADPRYTAGGTFLKAGVSTAPLQGGAAEGMARLLSAGLGGFLQAKVAGEYKERGEKAQSDMAKALSAGRGGTDEYGSVIPGDQNRMIQILAGNPDLADRAFALQGDMMKEERGQKQWETRSAAETKTRREDYGIQNEFQTARDNLTRAHQEFMADKSFANQTKLQQAQQAFAAAQQAASQAFQAGEGEKARGFQAGEGEKNRTFQAGQTDKGIAATAANQAAARAAPMEMVPHPADPSRMVPRAEAEAYATSQGNLPAQSALKAVETGKMTEDQTKAAGFYDRMINSESILADPKAIEAGSSRFNRAVTGETTGFGVPFGKEMAGQDYGKYEQAKRSFINAVLRKESGAVIGKEEFESADKQYFPQPGESAAVKEQKARERAIAIEAMKRAAGPGYKPSPVAPRPPAAGGIPKPPDGYDLVP